ncbi:MAG: hypothetical protein ACOYL6_08250 [Bacteriovoracaceae bacterium]
MILGQTTSPLFESTEELLIRDFFLKSDLYQFFPISNSQSIKFHWADSVETCRFIQKDIKALGSKYFEFKKLVEAVNELRMCPVWLMGEGQIISTNLHDLYHQVIMPDKFHHLQFTLKDFHELSLIGPTGPFKKVDVRAWLNRRDHLNIVFKNVLGGNINPREFRLRTEGQVLCFYGQEKDSCVFKIKQLTQTGLLMCTEEMHFFDHVKSLGTIELQMNADILRLHGNEKLPSIQDKVSESPRALFFSHEERDRIQVRTTDVKSFIYNNIYLGRSVPAHYLFVPYKEISVNDRNFATTTSNFVNYIKSLVLKEI